MNDPIDVDVDSGGNVLVADFDKLPGEEADQRRSVVDGGGFQRHRQHHRGAGRCDRREVPADRGQDGFERKSVHRNYTDDAILKVDTSGNITNVAGTLNSAGNTEGAPGIGKLNTPYQVDIDSAGSLYIADFQTSRDTEGPRDPGLPTQENS